MKIIADDGTEFDNVAGCLAHEATLPYLKLFAEVEAAVHADAAFAGKIEALGFRLRRDRYDRGEKRTRTAKGDTPPDPTLSASASSETTPPRSSESGGGLSGSGGDVREEAASVKRTSLGLMV